MIVFRHLPVAAALSALLSTTAALAQVIPIQGWYGSYRYTESVGRDALGQGPAVFVDHRLTIGPNGCRLTADGYQTDTQIRCVARPSGAALEVTFLSFGDGALVNQYGVRRYAVGQPLFTLARGSGGLVTRWAAYTPDDGKAPPGRYFVKQ